MKTGNLPLKQSVTYDSIKERVGEREAATSFTGLVAKTHVWD
jgi:hypothetical protein